MHCGQATRHQQLGFAQSFAFTPVWLAPKEYKIYRFESGEKIKQYIFFYFWSFVCEKYEKIKNHFTDNFDLFTRKKRIFMDIINWCKNQNKLSAKGTFN